MKNCALENYYDWKEATSADDVLMFCARSVGYAHLACAILHVLA